MVFFNVQYFLVLCPFYLWYAQDSFYWYHSDAFILALIYFSSGRVIIWLSINLCKIYSKDSDSGVNSHFAFISLTFSSLEDVPLSLGTVTWLSWGSLLLSS